MKSKMISILLVISFAVSVFAVPASASPVLTNDEQKKLDAAVTEIMKLLTPKMTDFEKTLTLHDWVCENIRYDEVGYYSGQGKMKANAYNAIVEHSAVCQGYALGFQALLDKAGIENKVVTGTADSAVASGGHAWNMVKLDGKWHHIDTAWDATVSGVIFYDYFLVSDSVLSANHKWDKKSFPSTAKTSFFDTDERENFHIKDNSVFYYNKSKEKIMKYNLGTKKTFELISLPKGVNSVTMYFYGDYFYYEGKLSGADNQAQLNGFYNMAEGKKYDNKIYGGFKGIEGDCAFFCVILASGKTYTNELRVLNIKTGEVKTFTTDNPLKGIYAGLSSSTVLNKKPSFTYNGKVYFYSDYDLYCYDVSKSALSKLKRPADVKVSDNVKVKQTIYQIAAREKNGQGYLEICILCPLSTGGFQQISSQSKIMS